jgi:hypothetical protein
MNLTTSSEAERQADQLRHELAGTLDAIATNLAPSNLASEALEAARSHTPDWLKRYWAFAASPAGLATVTATIGLGLASAYSFRRRRALRQRWR